MMMIGLVEVIKYMYHNFNYYVTVSEKTGYFRPYLLPSNEFRCFRELWV